MSKREKKKIAISEFISEKKLDKLMKIIETCSDTETSYDRIEMLLDDDFKTKDLGTNRLILYSRNKKYDDLVFKVAGDSHGIEANFREFYNGDLDKHLTYSYSISKNGVFVVQEKVTPLTSETAKEYKKEIREMLEGLEDKILLVDCKLSNFKNFGLRGDPKKGKVCLLDHGDTVPLPDYQDSKVVNCNEESFVSLRCKRYKDPTADKKNLKPCGGKLKYSKDYDYLICQKCDARVSINEAYREFMGDARIQVDESKSFNHYTDDFDPKAWQEHIKETCLKAMSYNNNEEKEDVNMKIKEINGEQCRQIRGYWIPQDIPQAYSVFLMNVKLNRVDPSALLEKLGKNPDDYKVRAADHNLPDNEEAENIYIAPAETDNSSSVDASDNESPIDKACRLADERAKRANEFVITYAEIAGGGTFNKIEVWKRLKAHVKNNINKNGRVRYEETDYKIYIEKTVCADTEDSGSNNTSNSEENDCKCGHTIHRKFDEYGNVLESTGVCNSIINDKIDDDESEDEEPDEEADDVFDSLLSKLTEDKRHRSDFDDDDEEDESDKFIEYYSIPSGSSQDDIAEILTEDCQTAKIVIYDGQESINYKGTYIPLCYLDDYRSAKRNAYLLPEKVQDIFDGIADDEDEEEDSVTTIDSHRPSHEELVETYTNNHNTGLSDEAREIIRSAVKDILTENDSIPFGKMARLIAKYDDDEHYTCKQQTEDGKLAVSLNSNTIMNTAVLLHELVPNMDICEDYSTRSYIFEQLESGDSHYEEDEDEEDTNENEEVSEEDMKEDSPADEDTSVEDREDYDDDSDKDDKDTDEDDSLTIKGGVTISSPAIEYNCIGDSMLTNSTIIENISKYNIVIDGDRMILTPKD